MSLEYFLNEYYPYGLMEVRSAGNGNLLFTAREGKLFDKYKCHKINYVDYQIRLHKSKDLSYSVMVIFISDVIKGGNK